MEAGIELLSMIRLSNASMQLYLKIVKWTEQYLIKSQNPLPGKMRQNILKK